MTTGVAYMKWTDQGLHAYQETVDRFDQARQLAEQYGVEIKEIFWTPGGPYDLVSIAEAQDYKSLAAFVLKLESLGNLRALFGEAYGPQEMQELVHTGG